MAQIVSNEIPSGLIDSSNKVYTLANNSLQITNLIVDWVEYFDFVCITGTNTVTLTDAPTLSIRADYIATWYSSTPWANLTTLQDLRDTFYDILRETEQDSSAYPLTLVDLLINAAQQKILAGRVINPINGQEARKGILHFLNQDVYYTNIKSTTTTADLTVWATTIPADPTWYSVTGGKLYLGWQIATYTWIDTVAWTFTGVSGIVFAHIAGTQISPAYDLPTDFSTIINVTYNNKIKLPAKQYDDVFEDLNSFKGSNFQRMNVTSMYESPYRVKPFYTIKDSQYLILYQLNDTWYPIHVRYEKTNSQMTTAASTCTIDDDTLARTTIPYLAVAEMMFNRWEEQRAGEIFAFAIAQCKLLYSRYNDTSFESQNWVQYRMWKWKLNI